VAKTGGRGCGSSGDGDCPSTSFCPSRWVPWPSVGFRSPGRRGRRRLSSRPSAARQESGGPVDGRGRGAGGELASTVRASEYCESDFFLKAMRHGVRTTRSEVGELISGLSAVGCGWAVGRGPWTALVSATIQKNKLPSNFHF
jgi:hypothetical protein